MFLYYCDVAGHQEEPWKFCCVEKESKASSGHCIFFVDHFSPTPPPSQGRCDSNPRSPLKDCQAAAQCCLLGNKERNLTPSIILATEISSLRSLDLKGIFYYCFVESWWKRVP